MPHNLNSFRFLEVDNSGARVRELSAPLAAAGISILYQSSYTSDFIFVSALQSSGTAIAIATRTRLHTSILIAFGSPSPFSVIAGLMYAGVHLLLCVFSVPISYDDMRAQRLLLGKIRSPIPGHVFARDGWL